MERIEKEETRRALHRAIRRELRSARPGTVLEHRVRGKIAAKVTVLDHGFVKYRGREYPSLGAAAMAAAKRLGQKSDHLSGPIYWGLVKRGGKQKKSKRTVH